MNRTPSREELTDALRVLTEECMENLKLFRSIEKGFVIGNRIDTLQTVLDKVSGILGPFPHNDTIHPDDMEPESFPFPNCCDRETIKAILRHGARDKYEKAYIRRAWGEHPEEVKQIREELRSERKSGFSESEVRRIRRVACVPDKNRPIEDVRFMALMCDLHTEEFLCIVREVEEEMRKKFKGEPSVLDQKIPEPREDELSIEIYLDDGRKFVYTVPSAGKAREHAAAIIKDGYRSGDGEGRFEHYPPHRINKVKVSGGSVPTIYPDTVTGT